MKAIVQSKYGNTDALQLKETDKPVAGANDVVIKVHATALHIGDYYTMLGSPFLLRLMMGLFRPKFGPGTDVAGVVESVGVNVTQWKPGDAVFGWCKGGFAEYACADASQFARKPDHLSFNQASSLVTSALAALEAVRGQGKVQPGHNVLVNGASGGVGPFVVQIAKYYGATVTAVCSTRNVENAVAMGADIVVDYTKEDFTQRNETYDCILDVAGSRSLKEYRRVLKPTGVVIPIGGSPNLLRILGIAVKSMFFKHQGAPFVSMPNTEDLHTMQELAESGRIQPFVEECYSLERIADAYRYIGEGHARGKIVVQPARS